MIYRIYSIFDNKAQTFSQPYYAPNTSVAVRSFEDACRDPNTSLHKHPGDYSLLYIGQFDDANATLLPADHPEHICHATAFGDHE